ncbi:MAG: TetR/AcrR family transcriptional regulator [Desulfoplanes sp.]
MAIESSETKLFLNLEPAKQERILNAAIHEFAEKGYDSASMNVVVKQAGISKGSLFKYFNNKTGLFTFVYRMALAQVKNYLRTVRDSTLDDPFFIRLEKIMQAGIGFIDRHPGLAKIYYRIIYTGDAPYKKEILKDIHIESQKFIESLILQAIERGELRKDLDPAIGAFMLECVLDRFIQAHHLDFIDPSLHLCGCPPDESDRWIRHVIDMFKRGLAAPLSTDSTA